MYHRFDENKYPSTNIRMDIFKKQISIIEQKKYKFYNPKEFDSNYKIPKSNKKILLTIDDAFSSFYENAWPFLKEKKIPFILFVSTEPIGKHGYMKWEEIKEIEKEDFAFIGNHSHSHEYLIDYNYEKFKKDIDQSIKIFNEKLGYNPIYFSYPFGEYSLEQKKYISQKFKYAFGQHSGVIDFNKDKFELPRFQINEEYGDLKRFTFLINLLTFQYKDLKHEDKLIKDKNKLIINFKEKFLFRRGRINCSLNDDEGWRWLGTQFSVKIN